MRCELIADLRTTGIGQPEPRERPAWRDRSRGIAVTPPREAAPSHSRGRSRGDGGVRDRSACSLPVSTASSREYVWSPKHEQRNQSRPDRKSARPVNDVGAPSELRPVGWSGVASSPSRASRSLARVVLLVHTGSQAASRPGARSPTKPPAPCACSPAQMRRSASAFGLHRRRPTRTRVHAKAELGAGRHNGWTVERRPASRDWRMRGAR